MQRTFETPARKSLAGAAAKEAIDTENLFSQPNHYILEPAAPKKVGFHSVVKQSTMAPASVDTEYENCIRKFSAPKPSSKRFTRPVFRSYFPEGQAGHDYWKLAVTLPDESFLQSIYDIDFKRKGTKSAHGHLAHLKKSVFSLLSNIYYLEVYRNPHKARVYCPHIALTVIYEAVHKTNIGGTRSGHHIKAANFYSQLSKAQQRLNRFLDSYVHRSASGQSFFTLENAEALICLRDYLKSQEEVFKVCFNVLHNETPKKYTAAEKTCRSISRQTCPPCTPDRQIATNTHRTPDNGRTPLAPPKDRSTDVLRELNDLSRHGSLLRAPQQQERISQEHDIYIEAKPRKLEFKSPQKPKARGSENIYKNPFMLLADDTSSSDCSDSSDTQHFKREMRETLGQLKLTEQQSRSAYSHQQAKKGKQAQPKERKPAKLKYFR